MIIIAVLGCSIPFQVFAARDIASSHVCRCHSNRQRKKSQQSTELLRGLFILGSQHVLGSSYAVDQLETFGWRKHESTKEDEDNIDEEDDEDGDD